LDFKRIKAEYIAGGTSYRKLAAKYNVPFGTLRRVAKQEAWTQKRAQVEHRVNTKMVETIIENETQKAVDIVDVADKLLGKITEVLGGVTTTQDIRHLTSALKDLREIKGIKSEADIREQEARIAKLQKEAETEEKTNDIVVNIAEEAEEYSR
jgi:hypothetical protein